MPVDKVVQVSQTKPLHGELPVYGQYTFGIAGERFFREIKDNGRIMGTRCDKCSLTYVPPRIYCERCFEGLKEWVAVPSTGTVHTYTIAHFDLDGAKLPEPTIIAMVQLDGVYGGLVHQLGEVRPEEVKIGMPVEVVFKDKAERVGSINDIAYFKPC